MLSFLTLGLCDLEKIWANGKILTVTGNLASALRHIYVKRTPLFGSGLTRFA